MLRNAGRSLVQVVAVFAAMLFSSAALARATPVDECGLVADYSKAPFFTCANFISADGKGLYFVENLGPFVAGNRVQMSGVVK